MTNTNPFIETVTTKKLIKGKMSLSGGNILTIYRINNDYLEMSLNFGKVIERNKVGIGLVSLRELATTFTEICDAMEGK